MSSIGNSQYSPKVAGYQKRVDGSSTFWTLSLLGHIKTRASFLVFSQSLTTIACTTEQSQQRYSLKKSYQAQDIQVSKCSAFLEEHREQSAHHQRQDSVYHTIQGKQRTPSAQSGILPLPIRSILPNRPLLPPAALSPLSLPYPLGAGILPIRLSPL